MFFRIFRPSERMEVLFNTDHITKIEVTYGEPGKDFEGNPTDWRTSLEVGMNNPDSTRWYRIFVAGETVLLRANPDDPVRNMIEDIYKNAIKG